LITVVVKCKNEEANLEKMLASVKGFADKVVVIDDLSTDRTVEVAKQHGALVFSALRHNGQIDLLDKQGFLHVEQGWILRMDADERLTPQLASELKRLQSSNTCEAVRFARSNMLFGKALRHGGWFESNRVGFFKASSWDRNWNCVIHSQVPVFGKVLEISKNHAFMIHEDYTSVAQFIERTLLRYSAVESTERHYDVKVFHFFLFPIRKFLGRYFVRKGFMDGVQGLVVAILLANYELLILLQIWDKNRSRNL
jgi:glycosyltransferase involved in cell wall biosynthesis